MGDETCSFACISVREADLHGTRSPLPRGHARREDSWACAEGRKGPRPREPFGIRSQADVFTRMVVSGAVSYRLRAHKLSTFFTWCRERLSWQALCRVAQAIRPLTAPVGPLMCRFCLWLIRSQWGSLVNDARSVPRGCRNRRANVRRRLFSGRLAINHQAEPLLED